MPQSLYKEGIIGKIFPEGTPLPESDTVYDANGKMAVPGFIDIHFHGAAGCDIGDGTPEAVETIAKAKLDEGVTTICPATCNVPGKVLVSAAEAAAEYKKKSGFSKIAGIHLEGPYINDNCLGGMLPDFVREPDIDEVLKLNEIFNIAIVSFAIEMEGGLKFTEDLKNAGIIPSCGHSAAIYSDFLTAKKAGLRHLTHFCNRMSGIHHREIGLVGAGLLDDDILIEVICDKIHICPEMIKFIFKTKNIEQIALITDSIKASWMPDGRYDIFGQNVNVVNGICRLLSDDKVLAGSTLRFYDALKNVHEITDLPLDQLIKTTGFNQARSLGLENLGKIEPGYIADIAILDEDFVPVSVFVNGLQISS